jgi:hypothetical protein
MDELHLDERELVEISMALDDRTEKLRSFGSYEMADHIQELMTKWDMFLAENSIPLSARLVVDEAE